MSTSFPAPFCSFTHAASQFIQSDEQYAGHKYILLSLWKWAIEPTYSMTWNSCTSLCLTTAAAGIRNTEDVARGSCTMREKHPTAARSPLEWALEHCSQEVPFAESSSLPTQKESTNKLVVSLLTNSAVHSTFSPQSATLFHTCIFCPPSHPKQQGLLWP